MKSGMRNISEMHFEVSSKCNLSCTYCYAYESDYRRSSLMPFNVACKYIDIVLSNTCSNTIDMVFHGGEPLLHSASWFENVMEYALRTSREKDKKVRFQMQSNLSLLTPQYLELIKSYHIIVGSSLDGPPSINESTRGASESVLANIKELIAARLFGGVICVLNSINCKRMAEVLDFYEHEGIFHVGTVISYDVGRGKSFVYLNGEMIFNAFKDIFDYLKRTNSEKVLETKLAAIIARFVNPPSKKDFSELLICSHPYCGAAIRTIYCDTNGSLYPCGCAISLEDNSLGDIRQFDNQFYLKVAESFHDKGNKYNKLCSHCSAARICSFGCPAFAKTDKHTSFAECQAYKMFFSFLEKTNDGSIKDLSLMLERRRNARQTIGKYTSDKILQ